MTVSNSANPAIHDDPARALSKNGAPEHGPRVDGRGGTELNWLERALDDLLAPRQEDPCDG
jgi:hypothetical protein